MTNKEATRLFREADQLYRSGLHAAALPILDQLDAAFPNTRHVLWPRALCLASLHRYEEALAIADRLVVDHDYERAQKVQRHLRALIEQRDAQAALSPIDVMGVATPVLDLPTDDLFDHDSFAAPPPLPTRQHEPGARASPLLVAGGGIAALAVVVGLAAYVWVSLTGGGAGEQEGSAGREPAAPVDAGQVPWPQLAGEIPLLSLEEGEAYPGQHSGRLVMPQPEWPGPMYIEWELARERWTEAQWAEWRAFQQGWSAQQRVRWAEQGAVWRADTREARQLAEAGPGGSGAADREQEARFGNSEHEAALRRLEQMSPIAIVALGLVLFTVVGFPLGYVLPLYLVLLFAGRLPKASLAENLGELAVDGVVWALLGLLFGVGWFLGLALVKRKYDLEWGATAILFLVSLAGNAIGSVLSVAFFFLALSALIA